MNLPDPREEMSITAENFRKFRDYFYARTGIHFDDNKRYFVDKRLVERINATGSRDFADYFSMLLFNQSTELQLLVNLMTTNETYFFREEYQLKCLVNSLLPEVARRKKQGSSIRNWSIPSSSGEEPYSVALYLLEHWPDVDAFDIELFASDIDTHVMALAERGIYQKRALQYVSQGMLDKYFVRLANGDYQIIENIRGSVTFTRVNITEPAETAGYRDFDIVFCRNLLIYFDELSRREAAETLYDALAPEGFICLGHSESMSRITTLFHPRKFPDGIVYQKPSS